MLSLSTIECRSLCVSVRTFLGEKVMMMSTSTRVGQIISSDLGFQDI